MITFHLRTLKDPNLDQQWPLLIVWFFRLPWGLTAKPYPELCRRISASTSDYSGQTIVRKEPRQVAKQIFHRISPFQALKTSVVIHVVQNLQQISREIGNLNSIAKWNLQYVWGCECACVRASIAPSINFTQDGCGCTEHSHLLSFSPITYTCLWICHRISEQFMHPVAIGYSLGYLAQMHSHIFVLPHYQIRG